MCGISGIINFNQRLVKKENIRMMMQRMKHRGPDDEGIFIDKNVGFGFVRLSILDLSQAGHQPMFSHNDRYVIVFNGEVYNYLELRDELKSKYNFKTETDTEIVLAAYQEWGEACLDRFNGMFSFVIYDLKRKIVFGARDRFGIKPLYYYQDKEIFIFASEIKSILPLLQKKESNDKLIYDYLLFNRTDHTVQTFFKGINKISHGSLFKINNNKLVTRKWYNLSEKVENIKVLSSTQYRELLKNSLEIRLRADVPIGVTLSGGIDSSTIVSSLINDFNIKDLNTFSAIYGNEDENDESEYIDEFASIVKNMHYTIPTAEVFFNEFEDFIESHNEPMPDTSPFVQYKVMELASKHVKVTLDGQGADEQLGGYHYFFGSYYLEMLKQFKLGKFVLENINYFKKHKKITALKYLLYYMLPNEWQVKVNHNTYLSVHKNFIERYKESDVNAMLYKPENLSDSLLQHFEFKLEHLLRYEDLNAMHFSIESRVPFLDHRLVEATLSTPSSQKIKNGETKHILREAVKDILPIKITNRKDKKGFSNPREKWFRTKQFKDFILELINSESFKNRGYFDSNMANKQYKDHLKGNVDNSKEIWKWINLELWFRKYIDN